SNVGPNSFMSGIHRSGSSESAVPTVSSLTLELIKATNRRESSPPRLLQALQIRVDEAHFAAHVGRPGKVVPGVGEIVGRGRLPGFPQRLLDVAGLTSPMPG